MTKFNDSQLKGTDDMMKELNKSQGRYIPVWMQEPTKKPGRKPSGNKKRKRTSVKKEK